MQQLAAKIVFYWGKLEQRKPSAEEKEPELTERACEESGRNKETRTKADSSFRLNDRQGAPPTIPLPPRLSIFPSDSQKILSSSDLSHGHWRQSKPLPHDPSLVPVSRTCSHSPPQPRFRWIGGGAKGHLEGEKSPTSVPESLFPDSVPVTNWDPTCLTSLVTSAHLVETVALWAVSRAVLSTCDHRWGLTAPIWIFLKLRFQRCSAKRSSGTKCSWHRTGSGLIPEPAQRSL